GVQRLQVRVGVVVGVPHAVVGEGDDLVGGGLRAHRPAAVAVLAGAVLVDVVAQVQPGVEVAAGREVAVGRGVAWVVAGGGHQAEARLGQGGDGGGGGAGARDAGVGAAGGEAEPGVGGGPQAADVGLHGVVGRGGRAGGPPRDDVGERAV